MFARMGWKKMIGIRGVLLVVLLLSGVGCGRRMGQVSGRVCYAGRPLPGGTILLLASDGKPYRGQIEVDGRFRVLDVPLGEAKVCVTSLIESPPSVGRSSAAVASRVSQPATMYSRIPTHYGDLTRSGLTVTVEEDSTLELDLK